MYVTKVWFFASFEAPKMAGFVRRTKNGRGAFRTGAKIHFSEKYSGVRGTLTEDGEWKPLPVLQDHRINPRSEMFWGPFSYASGLSQGKK